MNPNVEIVNKAYSTGLLEKNEIVALLSDSNINSYLYEKAGHKKNEILGNEVHLRALIEISNICKQNCLYCGVRRDNKAVQRYKLTNEEILNLARIAKKNNFYTVVLQGGENEVYTTDEFCKILSEIKQMDLAITLSIGEKTHDEYARLKEAGADRFLLRIETTDDVLYEKMDPGMSFQNRIRCLRNLKHLGYETGSGSLIGLPGQSFESIADDILFFKEIDADMIGVGPFIAHPDTPLKDCANGDLFLALKVMAIIRLLMPDINIPATTAMEALNSDGRIIALKSGANVLMLNFTDEFHRNMYDLYPGKQEVALSTRLNLKELNDQLNLHGMKVSEHKGFRKFAKPQ
ncbi:MAG TPA: [FeFe] hydrogenase H-cluster radical SAM maturase HydE [Candidatus Cloacimonadota bacterium]|nr:[FeFe] hydrogenase H-cluster radical SAM maturase HydE [Candidatus Cloacimonadota bacterium]HOD55121.1 [FeFe] hydrogenase H-cluster radical SAM maturase HydE [Candidatus Cloacimonadota bacterium]